MRVFIYMCTHRRLRTCVYDWQAHTSACCMCAYVCVLVGGYAHEHAPAKSLAHVCESLPAHVMSFPVILVCFCCVVESQTGSLRVKGSHGGVTYTYS